MRKFGNLIQFMVRKMAYIIKFIRFHSCVDVDEILSAESEGTIYLCVGENQRYATISKAVEDWIFRYEKAKAVIYLYAGEYNESVKLFGHGEVNLSFIGEDKHKVIWRTTTGYYRDAPLHIQGNVLIKGITFVADHTDNPEFTYTTLAGVPSVWKENCGGAYALHMDFQGEGMTRVEDCILISYQNAALGCGTRKNQTIDIRDCELYSYTSPAAIDEIANNGAMMYHTSAEPKQVNQRLVMHRVKVYSLHHRAMEYKVYSRDANISKVEFVDCHFYGGGRKNTVHFRGIGHIYLSRHSHGNNIAKCNSK